MPNTHAPYPPAFKEEAVRLVHSSDKSIPEIAKDLGIDRHTAAKYGQMRPFDGVPV